MSGLKSGPISRTKATATLKSKSNSNSKEQKQQQLSRAKATQKLGCLKHELLFGGHRCG
jgi:hypothetical protein